MAGRWPSFASWSRHRGGDVRQVDEPERLPQARYQETLYAEENGYAAEVNALKVAQATLELGAGRARKTDPIDPAVGVVVHKKVGDRVAKGDPLFTVHANDPEKLARAKAVLAEAVVLSPEPQTPPPAFYDTIVAVPAD